MFNLKKKHLLFISHDATRTGAPILLLNLVKAIGKNYQVDFLLKNGGELFNEFSESAITSIAAKPQKRTIYKRILKKIRKGEEKRFEISNLKWKEYDFVISNTITNGDLLPEIRKFYKGPIISYVHELEMATRFFTNEIDLKQLIACSNAYFVPSEAVKNHLITNVGISPEKIEVLHYYIPPFKINLQNKPLQRDFLIGSVGTLDWRKSPDLFIVIAKAFFKKLPDANVQFIWKGAADGSVEMDRLKYDIKKAGLKSKVSFVGASSDVAGFFNSISLFLLTSREDPYPLVVLEAANEEVPTLCFAGAGGSPEFIEQSQGGRIISYLDINEAVDAIIYYYRNRQALSSDGKKARAELLRTHQNIEYITSQFTSALQKVENNI